MFILFGFGKKTVKEYGGQDEILCRRCNNRKSWAYKKVTTWFTLFFIPVIPYNTAYVRICPICGEYDKMSKADFMAKVSDAGTEANADSQYSGMTETQANYMKEIAAIKEENRNTVENQ